MLTYLAVIMIRLGLIYASIHLLRLHYLFLKPTFCDTSLHDVSCLELSVKRGYNRSISDLFLQKSVFSRSAITCIFAQPQTEIRVFQMANCTRFASCKKLTDIRLVALAKCKSLPI